VLNQLTAFAKNLFSCRISFDGRFRALIMERKRFCRRDAVKKELSSSFHSPEKITADEFRSWEAARENNARVGQE
jgi:hypothetical protein